MAAKYGRKTFFGKRCQMSLRIENLVQVSLSRIIFEINAFCFSAEI